MKNKTTLKDIHTFQNQQFKLISLIKLLFIMLPFLFKNVFAQFNKQQCLNETNNNTKYLKIKLTYIKTDTEASIKNLLRIMNQNITESITDINQYFEITQLNNNEQCLNRTNHLKTKFMNIKTDAEESINVLEKMKQNITESIKDLDQYMQTTQSQCILYEYTQTRIQTLIDKLSNIITVNNSSLNSNVKNEFKSEMVNLEDNINQWLIESCPKANIDLDESELLILNKIIQEELIEHIVHAISNADYDQAVKLFEQISIDNDIYIIVNTIYSNKLTINKFYLILNFAKKVEDTRKANIVYIALSGELIKKSTILTDNDKCLKLIELINNNNTDVDSNEIKNIIKLLKNKLRRTINEFLKSLLILKNTYDIKLGFDSINNIYKVDDDLVEEIFKNFLSSAKLQGVYKVVYNNLLKFIKVFGCKSQELLVEAINIGLVNTFDRINTEELLEMFRKYRKIEELYKNELCIDVIKRIRERMMRTVPLSLFYMIFSEKHCIRNVGLDEYLKITSTTLNSKAGVSIQFKNIDTSNRNETDSYKEWKIKYMYNNNIFTIFNLHFKEYLYVTKEYFHDNRFVHSSVNNVVNETGWIFEPFGDDVYIVNSVYDEYLYSSCKDCDSRVAYVYTKLVDDDNHCIDRRCVWSIDDCTS